MENNTNTSIDINIESYNWITMKGIKYTLKIDGKIVLKSNYFSLIDKEIRKYLRLRFKEYVK